MGNPTELANKARSTLAAALQALQGDDVPDELMAVAEPIATTMGILHRIENSGTAEAEECTQALDNVRGALDQLQTAPPCSAVDKAMEAVAGSLSKLFALSKAVRPSSPPMQPATAKPAPGFEPPKIEPAPRSAPPRPTSKRPSIDPHAPADPHARTMAADAEIPPPSAAVGGLAGLKATLPIDHEHKPVRAEVPAYQPVFGTPDHEAKTIELPKAGVPGPLASPQPQLSPQFSPQAAPQLSPQASPQPAPYQPAFSPPAAPAPEQSAAKRVPGMTDAPVPPSTANFIEVELGAHSGSNFYKGLSGNDVIDHGGVFIATYKIPKVGDPVALRVHLPGDLQFDGDAIVQWTRDVRGGESDPGFGAKFTRISDEGRQLVYRYVKNREPMFYDDL